MFLMVEATYTDDAGKEYEISMNIENGIITSRTYDGDPF